jgi:hypothetical protein
VTVDHVIAGPGGVHVVEYVAGVGLAVATELDSVARAAAELAALLPLRYRARVQPAVCLVDGEARAEAKRGVLVTTPDTLGHIVRSTPAVLSTSEVADAFGILSASLAPAAVRYAADRRWAGWRRPGWRWPGWRWPGVLVARNRRPGPGQVAAIEGCAPGAPLRGDARAVRMGP